MPGRLQLALFVVVSGPRLGGHDQPGDGAAAEGAGGQRLGLRRRVGLGVAAQRQRARRAHLVPALPDLDAARLLEADAAHLRVASLHREIGIIKQPEQKQDPRRREGGRAEITTPSMMMHVQLY